MFEQVAGRTSIMRRFLDLRIASQRGFDSVCNVRFTALPFSEGPAIGTLVLES
jgi:hypothetical protein